MLLIVEVYEASALSYTLVNLHYMINCLDILMAEELVDNSDPVFAKDDGD